MTEHGPNRLARETSPYLKQHAYNPVDWYPWGDEAFQRASAEDKPVFVSVGYSSCHWCHVMEHESFEDADVARILRESFISIKVDREEHPDVDALYMTATQLMTGHGGWPNSVWLMPDKRPWYAGTYFPKEDRPGRIGFKSLLTKLAAVWANNRKGVEEQAIALMDAIRKNNQTRTGTTSLDLDHHTLLSQHIQNHYRDQFDARHGGFGSAPKFPPHSGLLLLMESLKSNPSGETEIMIKASLDAMMRGGIYDHVGGGFHRYSTDEEWRLPHFEKMLYDNALLLKAYALAAKVFQRDDYRRIAHETASWVIREMSHPDGGFYSALDADSEGEEGLYYTWTVAELERLLPPDNLNLFCASYQILPGGNYEDESSGQMTGRNIPFLGKGSAEKEIVETEKIRALLLDARTKRVRPLRDEKIISSWNGLMIGALAAAGKLLGEPGLIKHAIKARQFIELHSRSGGDLKRCWCEETARHPAMLDDYAALAVADVELFEATGDQYHLHQAHALAQRIMTRFYDPDSGNLFMTDGQDPVAGLRLQDLFDQGSPAGSGLAVEALIRIGIAMDDHALSEAGISIARRNAFIMQRSPSSAASMLNGFLKAVPPDLPVFSIALLSNQVTDKAEGLLTCQLPDGYKLNEYFGVEGKSTIKAEWADLGNSIRVEITPEAVLSWRVLFSSPVPLQGTHMLSIHYQLCTDKECRAVAQTTLPVNFPG